MLRKERVQFLEVANHLFPSSQESSIFPTIQNWWSPASFTRVVTLMSETNHPSIPPLTLGDDPLHVPGLGRGLPSSFLPFSCCLFLFSLSCLPSLAPAKAGWAGHLFLGMNDQLYTPPPSRLPAPNGAGKGRGNSNNSTEGNTGAVYTFFPSQPSLCLHVTFGEPQKMYKCPVLMLVEKL